MAEIYNEPADPIVRGTFATAKQSWGDLFKWKQRVAVTNDDGETYCEWQSPRPLRNPISLFAQLSARDWLFFLVGLAAWTADAFDFHALSIQTVKLAKYYHTSKTNVTTAITLTLLLRSVGAAMFGLAGDKFGRKYPMVINMIILGLLQVATIYSSTFSQFLAVRSLFGLFMGGVYGNAIAMALENCPVDARGLMSGILQQGYSLGYVIAASCNLGVGGSTDSWKTVFWIGTGLSIAVGLIRLLFPESKQFVAAKKAGAGHSSPRAFWIETRKMLAQEWRMCVYCIILMTWFNYYSHTREKVRGSKMGVNRPGEASSFRELNSYLSTSSNKENLEHATFATSQDSYTTFMLTQKELNNAAASRASIIMKTGACVGGTIIGYISQWFGRRRAIIVSALVSGLLIPAWILPTTERSLSATGFFMQFFVQGAWGVIPIHLNELSPPAYRSSFPGITYQLGNMISSPSAQIVNAIAEKITVTAVDGEPAPAYGPTMGIATAIIAIGIAVTTAFGPERRGRQFELAKPAGVTTEMQGQGKLDVENQLTIAEREKEEVGQLENVNVPEKH